MRRKRPRRGYSLFATHPAPASRMADLRVSSREVTGGTGPQARGRDRYLKALSSHRARFLDDQVKLNDPGASLYIVNNLAKDGWNGLLRFYEAEIWRLRGQKGDDARAALGYALAKTGRREEGKAALARYLALAPNASDAPMVRFALAQ
jgi:hypothetical protein